MHESIAQVDAATAVLDPSERLDALAEQFERQAAETEAWLTTELARAKADVERWAS